VAPICFISVESYESRYLYEFLIELIDISDLIGTPPILPLSATRSIVFFYLKCGNSSTVTYSSSSL